MIKKKTARIWRAISRFIAMCVMTSLYRIETFGRDNVPLDGAVLVLCNHQSFFDPMFAQSFVKRNFIFVARDSLFRVPVIGALITSFGTVPIRRGEADMSAIKRILRLLKEREVICIFPEATRCQDGRVREFKPGISLIARKSGAVIVPTVIEGAFEIWPRHRKFPKTGRVQVEYGKPLMPKEIKRMSPEEFGKTVTKSIREMQNRCRTRMGKEPFDYSYEPGISAAAGQTQAAEMGSKSK